MTYKSFSLFENDEKPGNQHSRFFESSNVMLRLTGCTGHICQSYMIETFIKQVGATQRYSAVE